MNVLIACEFSGTVRRAFRKNGFAAWSCDLLAAADASPYHIQGDVMELLHAHPGYHNHTWDLMIAHPPCTYLANSGVRWLHSQGGRWEKMEQATRFFRDLLGAPVEHIAVENPVMHGYATERIGRRHDQTIQPWQFGEDASKRTCFWLKNLPPLEPTKIVGPTRLVCCGLDVPEGAGKYSCPNCNGERVARRVYANQTPTGQNNLGPSADRWKLRSLTYPGIADAMVQQWGTWALARAGRT